MINIPQDQPISSPLYGQQAPRDSIVQALMNQVGTSPQQSQSNSGGIGGLSPEALMSLAKYFNAPAPFTGQANGGTYNYQGPSAMPSWLGGTPGAGYTFTDQGGNVSTLGGSLGDFHY